MSVTDSPGQRALRVVESSPIFKEPIGPAVKTKSKRKKVLDEDEYIEKMGKIIERDFFPDLEKLRAQNAYLDAVDTNDVVKLRELYEKYSSGAKPQRERLASPATFETPIVRHGGAADEGETSHQEEVAPTPSRSDDGKHPRKKGDSRSLDAFLSTHTSEDNESFQDIMKESAIRHKHKYGWLYQDEEEINKDLSKQLALPSIEQQAQIEDKPFNIDTWKFKNQNYIMYVPDGVELTAEEKMEQAKRQQEIIHTNTRLTTNPFDEHQNKEVIRELAVVQAKTNDGKIGVDGKEVTVSTPKVNGYGFVKMNSPMPGVMDSPLMTWGEIEGTPFRLDGSDTPVRPTSGPSFKMPAPPKREKIAHALAEKAGERHRDKKQKALETARRQLRSPSPRLGTGPLERLNTMSPAAQRLASHQIRTGDSALRASYSPSPLRTPSTPSRTPSTSHTPSTPRTPGSRTPKKIPTPKINLTDNLLQLPKRPRAADFF